MVRRHKIMYFWRFTWSAGGEIGWEIKVLIICLRHEVFLQLFILNIVGFCSIAPSPPLKKIWSSRLWFYCDSADIGCSFFFFFFFFKYCFWIIVGFIAHLGDLTKFVSHLRMNSQNLSRFFRIHWKKMKNRAEEWIWQLGIWSIWRMNSQILPRFLSNALKKKWKFGVEIAYGNFGYYSFAAWMLRIYLFFPTFTDQMENWGECGLWELRVLATCGPNSQNSPSFSRIH